jgi:hypothetical protein
MRATAALLLVAVLALAGCGGDGGKKAARRRAVDSYFAKVNAVQAQYRSDLVQANAALAAFGTNDPELLPKLRRSVQTLDGVRAQLSALEPPADARTIHRELLLLYGGEASLAREVTELTAFIPRVRVAFARFAVATDAFRRAARVATARTDDADALDAYADGTDAAAARLDALAPPPVLESWRDDQAAWLRDAARTSRRLAAALRANDAHAVSTLAPQFRDAVGRQPGVSRAQQRAVTAYNERLRRIRALALRIYRARAALAQRLG